MSSFTTPLDYRRLDDGRLWEILAPFTYHVGAEDSGVVVTVPVGFVTDLTSSPRGLWNLFPPSGGQYDKAAVIHDYLYATQRLMAAPVSRARVDAIFLEAMAVLGVGWFTRHLIYRAVRIGGRGVWQQHAQALLVAARQTR